MWVGSLVHQAQAIISRGSSPDLGKTPDHYCFALQMGCKATSSMCCVMHVKVPRYTYTVQRSGSPRCFLVWSTENRATGPCCCMGLIIRTYSLYKLCKKIVALRDALPYDKALKRKLPIIIK